MNNEDVDNVEAVLFTDEDIASIATNDRNVDLFASVFSVNAPVVVGNIKKYEVMKFLITNNRGQKIQCAIWEKDIPLKRALIKPGSIVHINGAWASEVDPKWNNGTVRFELSIKTSTEIKIVQENYAMDQEDAPATQIVIDDVGDYESQFIAFTGFIKSPFQLVSSRGASSFGCSTICKGIRIADEIKSERIKIRVAQYVERNEISVGVRVRVKGIPIEETDNFNVTKMFFYISSMENIEIIPGRRKRSMEMIQCERVAKKNRAA